MKLDTKYHGQKEIQDADIITFDHGIPGFEDEKKFVLLGFPDNIVFFALQSVKNPALSFVVMEPFSFFPDFQFKLEEPLIEALAAEKKEDLTVLVILTVTDPFENTTANLQAPIVIHKQTQSARQIILTGTDYRTRHSLFPAGSQKEG